MTDHLRTLVRKMAAMRPPRRLFNRRRDVQGNPIRSRKAHNRSGMGRGWARIVLVDPCVYCGLRPAEGRKNTLEHVVPLAAGGGPDWMNLAGACKRCNQAKGNTPLVLFLLERERYRRECAAREAEARVVEERKRAGAAAMDEWRRDRPDLFKPSPHLTPERRPGGFKMGDAVRWK